MPTKNDVVSTTVDLATSSTTTAGQLFTDRAEEAGHALAHAGRVATDKAADVAQDAGAQAGAAKDTALEAAAAIKDRAAATFNAVAEQMPQTPQQWRAAGQQLTDRVRSNPRPWLIGTGAVLLVWWLGRRSARSK
ncbi:hypothetical protein [Catellatospora vulcania]|uniref:hypothetical protein n=1 Tax=Catellatospora vulcania TaxID=1460450 RepID=UPI0012D4BAE3|nr:hypothetical protein [Catellatospora vulcania]